MKQQHQQNNHEHQGRNRQKQTTKQNPSALARFTAHFNCLNLANILVCEGDSEGEKCQPRIIASEGGVQDAGKRGSTQDASANQKIRRRLVAPDQRSSPFPSNSAKRKTKSDLHLPANAIDATAIHQQNEGAIIIDERDSVVLAFWPSLLGGRCRYFCTARAHCPRYL